MDKLQLLTNNQVGHLSVDIFSQVEIIFNKKADEIKETILPKVAEEVKINKDAIEHREIRATKLAKVEKIGKLVLQLQAIDSDIKIDLENSNYDVRWDVIDYIQNTETYIKEYNESTERSCTTYAKNKLERDANVHNVWNLLREIHKNIDARLALTLVDDYETVKEAILDTIDVDDHF